MKPNIILLPGNGGASPKRDHWFPWVTTEIKKLGLEVMAQEMPDSQIAHMNIWLPFIKNELKADENSIIIGHSSGGVAALRYLEENRLFGAIVVGVNYTDLGYPEEKEAGWYEKPWQWEKIIQNAQWIAQFDSIDDPFIPIEEPRYIQKQLNSEYYEFSDRGHFMISENPRNATFLEIIDVLKQKLKWTQT